MKDALDEMKVLLKAAREAEIEEQKAKHRQFGLDARDIAAFSNIHPAQRGDKVRVKNAPEVKTAGSGWQEPTKLSSPPGINLIDRMVEIQTLRERRDALLAENEKLRALAALKEKP
jgi:hypothetical protein